MHPHDYESGSQPASQPHPQAPREYEELRVASLQAPQPPPRSPLRNPRQASDYLLARHGITRSHATLNKLRVVGGGPVYRMIGARNIGYEEAALDEWAAALVSRPMRSTSEAA